MIHRRMVLAVLVLSFLLSSSSAHAGLYSWTDSSGNQYYADELSKVPSEYRSQARDLESGGASQAEEVQQQPAKRSQKRISPGSDKPVQEHVDKYGRGETYWRSKADNLRQQLQDEQVTADTLNRQQAECEGKQLYVRGLPKDCAAQYRNQKIKSEQKIDRLRKNLEVDLPEEARRADAYPGWVR